jgi:hypothetical protein
MLLMPLFAPLSFFFLLPRRYALLPAPTDIASGRHIAFDTPLIDEY